MALNKEKFELGVVTVEVKTASGESHLEDWNPKDATDAETYAKETAQCSDVASTVFSDNRTGRTITFKNESEKQRESTCV